MTHLSDLRLDELVRGEHASPEEARAHVAECAQCRARLDEIEGARTAFLAEDPRLPVPLRRRATWIAAATMLASAAAALLLVVRPSGERAKGGPQLGLYVQHGGVVRPAGPREPVAPGDTLQLTYQIERARYVAVLSLDGAGHASVYFPDGPRAVELPPARDAPLPRSTILDEILGEETLHGLFCDEPVVLAPLRAALERDRALPPVERCSVVRLTIVKK
jgi:hypothetical protein